MHLCSKAELADAHTAIAAARATSGRDADQLEQEQARLAVRLAELEGTLRDAVQVAQQRLAKADVLALRLRGLLEDERARARAAVQALAEAAVATGAVLEELNLEEWTDDKAPTDDLKITGHEITGCARRKDDQAGKSEVWSACTHNVERSSYARYGRADPRGCTCMPVLL